MVRRVEECAPAGGALLTMARGSLQRVGPFAQSGSFPWAIQSSVEALLEETSQWRAEHHVSRQAGR
jgi:hypothetical protein